MPAPRRTRLTQTRLFQLLHYDKRTGVFTWRQNRGRSAKRGDPAGSLQSNGTRLITVDGRPYLANRLAFLYVTGAMPAYRLTTRDRNPANTRWANIAEESEFFSDSVPAVYQRERRAYRRQLIDAGILQVPPGKRAPWR